MSTFNEEICCRTRTGLPADFVGAVHGKPLKEVLEHMTDDELEFDVRDKELRIVGKRKKAGIRMEADILLPLDQVEAPAGDDWVTLDNPEDFAAAIRTVVPVAGTNRDEYIFTCVHVAPEFLESCDRTQAAKYEITTGFARNFLVRANSLAHVANLGITRVAMTSNWVHFRNKLLLFSCRLDLQDYVNMAPIWEFKGAPATLPRGAAEAAKLGSVFSGEDAENDKVRVSLTDGHMVVRGEGLFGWASADLEMAYRGPDVAFRIASATLEKLVKDHTDVEICAGKLRVVGERWVYHACLGAIPTEEAQTVPVGADESESEPEEQDNGDE